MIDFDHGDIQSELFDSRKYLFITFSTESQFPLKIIKCMKII